MDEPAGKTDVSTSESEPIHEIRKTKDQPGALNLALAMFRERQIRVLDFWVDDGVLHFKIMRTRSN